MKVLLTRAARDDLMSIANFIARDNPPRAISFVAELEGVCARLVDTPRGFPLVPRYELQGIRRRSWRSYGILYAERESNVVVFRILGPGQDHDRLLQLR